MIKVVQHVPGWAWDPGRSERAAEVATLAELLAIPWIRSWSTDHKFHRYSLSDGCLLMAELDAGFVWWVLAHLHGPGIDELGLPVWRARSRGRN